MLSDPFKRCLYFGSACVTLRIGYSDPRRQAGSILQGVDVIIKRSTFEDGPEDVDGEDHRPQRYPRIPTAIHFNTCYPDQYDYLTAPDTNLGYAAYFTALHEAGHALGLSDFSYIRILTFDGYRMSHPTITDSLLNYESETGVYEPDCSPHPFDIMAIHALYQMVNP